MVKREEDNIEKVKEMFVRINHILNLKQSNSMNVYAAILDTKLNRAGSKITHLNSIVQCHEQDCSKWESKNQILDQ